MNTIDQAGSITVNKECEQATSIEQLLRDKIKVFKVNGLSTDEEEASLAELEKQYPHVLNSPGFDGNSS